jgi:hypothetical protein
MTTGVCIVALSEGRAVAGEVVRAADLNQIIDALEGDVDETLAYHLRSESGEDFIVTLSDAAGTREFQIKDSAGNTVFSVDSDGNVTQAGTFSPGSLTLTASTSPTPTTDGAMEWDNDDNELVIGNGSGQSVFLPENKVWKLVGIDTTERSNSTNGGGDFAEITLTESVPATVPMMITFQARNPTGGTFLLGLKLNTTTVLSGVSALGTAANTVGHAVIDIPPREANYLQTTVLNARSHATGSSTSTGDTAICANVDAPTDPITSVTIRGGPSGNTNTMYIKNVYVYRLAVE